MASIYGRAGCLAVTAAMLAAMQGCERQAASSAMPLTEAARPVSRPASTPAPVAPGIEPEGYTTTGPLVVDQQAEILAERDGRLTAVRADIGDRIRRGQVLVLLDDRELQAARAAKAAKIESLKALVREDEAEQEGDASDLRRYDLMLADRIISVEDWEHVKYKLAKAVAEVARDKAEAAAAEFDLHAMDIQLEQSRVVAPFDGVIGRRTVRVAQEVKKGDALMWLTAESPMHVVFTVPESAMAGFRVGAGLELTSALYPGLKQRAAVLRVSPVVDAASGSLEVVGDLRQPSPVLKPGMSMQVRLSRP